MSTSTIERWLPVRGYEGSYEVSDFGRVRSLDRIVINRGNRDPRAGRLLVPCKTGKGYLSVGLCKGGVSKLICVHRIVAIAFVIEIPNSPHVNHIDSNKTNNASSNLEWVTPKQNTHHAIAAGKFAIAHINGRTLAMNNPARATKLTAADVAMIRAACSKGDERQVDIGKRFGIGQAMVSRIHRGTNWSTQVNIKCAKPSA